MRDDEGGRQRDMFLGKFGKPTFPQSHILARRDSICFVFIAFFFNISLPARHGHVVVL